MFACHIETKSKIYNTLDFPGQVRTDVLEYQPAIRLKQMEIYQGRLFFRMSLEIYDLANGVVNFRCIAIQRDSTLKLTTAKLHAIPNYGTYRPW